MRKYFGFRDKTEFLKLVNDPKNNVRFIRFLFVDVLGDLHEFTIPISELTDTFYHGKNFDGGLLGAAFKKEEIDLKFFPDPSTGSILPWNYKSHNGEYEWKEAIIFGNLKTAKGEQYAGDPRFILKQNIESSKEIMKFDHFYIGPEIEFYLLPDNPDMDFDENRNRVNSDKESAIRKEIQLYLEEMGIATESSHHEKSTSQHQINLKYDDALNTADKIMVFRYIVQTIAEGHNLHASFLPKPISNLAGSGMHLHQSLWLKSKNLFYDDKDRNRLSMFGKKFIAGQLKYGDDITLITNQFTNSYERLHHNSNAPSYKIWGKKNTSNYIRVPEIQEEKKKGTKIESRSPDSACNPYLTIATLLGAGIQGIKENLELDLPFNKQFNKVTEDELNKLEKLPTNLEDALKVFRDSRITETILGKTIFESIIINKEKEIEQTNSDSNNGEIKLKISDYKIKNFLPNFLH